MKRIGEWDPYFETWDITENNLRRLFARGWQPCPKLTEQMKRRDGLTLDLPYGVSFDRKNAIIVLEI